MSPEDQESIFGKDKLKTAYLKKKRSLNLNKRATKDYIERMSEEKDDLKSIKVYKFDNTKENWHEFALKYRVIADTRDYRGIIDGSVVPPDKMAVITITAEDTGAVLKEKKDKLKARKANKIGYRDLVMSTAGISFTIVQNDVSEELPSGDLKKAWERLERRWNPKTREDKVEVYTNFLNYKLENTRQRPMDYSIQYHMHQIMERQKVIDEYRNMTMEGLDLIPLESNLHRYHPVIISQIINMIESDNFCHHQTFESVKSNLRNMWSEGIQELENASAHCTDGDDNNDDMDGVEVIDLCSVSRSGTDTISEGKESAMQESQDKSKHDKINKKAAELKTVRNESTTKKDNIESAMMCWESTESFVEKEHREEPEKMTNKPVKTTEKQKHEEEHVKPTLNIGNQLKISIEEFSWEREGDGPTLGGEEPKNSK